MKSNLKLTIFYALGGLLVLSAVALAGSLTPSANTNTATMVTLNDIYQKILSNTYLASPSHDLSTTSSPTGTMHSLSDIYSAIPTISGGSIISGSSIMGVSGTYNILNLTSGNVAKDVTYGTSSVGILTSSLTWDTIDGPGGGSNAWNNGVAYCTALSTDQSIVWRLPSVTELVSKYNINPSGFAAGLYWTGVTVSTNSALAYLVLMSDGSVTSVTKTSPGGYTRCVH